MVALTTVAAAVALIVVLVNGSADGSPHPSGATRPQNLAAADRSSSAAGTSTPAAATTPASAASTPASTTPTSSSTAATPAAAPRASGTSPGTKAHAAKPPLTYVVRRGDNLTVIAKWFHLHGYGSLYERNRAVIGNDPNLIFPGQHITVSSAGMTVGH